MPVIETNELINKSIPAPVMEAVLTLMRRYNVPEADRLLWAYTQRELMQQLLTYYRSQKEPNLA